MFTPFLEHGPTLRLYECSRFLEKLPFKFRSHPISQLFVLRDEGNHGDTLIQFHSQLCEEFLLRWRRGFRWLWTVHDFEFLHPHLFPAELFPMSFTLPSCL